MIQICNIAQCKRNNGRTTQEGRYYIFKDVALELHNKYAALAADSKLASPQQICSEQADIYLGFPLSPV